MRNVNQDSLVAVGLAQPLMSQDQLEREAAWNAIWSERIYKRWAEVLRLLVGILVENYAVEGTHVAQQWYEYSRSSDQHQQAIQDTWD